MTSIVGPFAGVENDYRRERITGSFREHKRGTRRLFHRRAPKGAAEPVVDWWGGE
jgi:hypothetical protein